MTPKLAGLVSENEAMGLDNHTSGPVEVSDEEKVARVFERARKIEANRGGRKQHIVPASYLRRWAEDDRVRVTEVATRHSYCAKPDKVGLETDFYRLEADGLDPDEVPPLALEVLLSEIEGQAKLGLDELLAEGQPDPEHGVYLAWFIALQTTRGRAFRATLRAQAHEAIKLQYGDLDAAGVRRLMRENGNEVTDETVEAGLDAIAKIVAGEWAVSPQDAALAATAAQAAGELVKLLLLGRHWLVYDTPPLLVTCDEPVVALAGPIGDRGEQGGFGDAPIILFPLNPSKLLVLLRRDLEPEAHFELDTLEVADINRELVAASTRWVFEKPSRHIGARMPVPGPPPPLVTEHWEGSIEEGRVVHRMHRPTRWVAAPQTPWPVARWWETGRYI